MGPGAGPGPAAGEALAVAAVRHGVHGILVALERVQQVTVAAVVHQHAAAHARHQLRAVGLVRDAVAHAAHAVALGLLIHREEEEEEDEEEEGGQPVERQTTGNEASAGYA